MRADPLLKKGYRYGWFIAEGEWGRSLPAGNDVVQVRNFFNENSMYFFPFLSLFYVYIHFSHEFSSYSLFLWTFAVITWSKRTCPVHEVGRKVSGVIKKFHSLQSEVDVMSITRLARAGLIEESLPSSLRGDSRMTMWCCLGTLPSLVLWGAPIICTIFFWRPSFFFFLNVSFCQ